jgi:hypothetical protein
VQCTSFCIDGGRRKRWVFETECKTLLKCNRNAQHNVIVRKLVKKLDRVLGSRKTACWATAAGTTEFLNRLPQKRGLKPYYYDKYYLWHNVIVNFGLKNLSG